MDVNKNVEIDIYSCVWDIHGDAIPWHTIQDFRIDTMCMWTGKFWRLNETKIDYTKYVQELESLGARKVFHKVENYEEYSTNCIKTIKPFRLNFQMYKTPIILLNRKSMWYSIKQAFDMIPNPSDYDYIIRSRTDNLFAADIVLSPTIKVGSQTVKIQNSTPLQNPHIREVIRFFEIAAPSSDSSIIIPYREHDSNKYIDDMWFMGTPDVMKKVTRIYDKLDYYIDKLLPLNRPGVENETILTAEILSNNIHINYFQKLPALAKA